MSHPAPADLSRLAALAQTRGDLRVVLLRAQTELFVAGRRDPAAIAVFEALALGFVPLVGHAALVEMARALGPVAETPAGVRAALATRLADLRGTTRNGPETPAEAEDDDLVLARDATQVLDGRLLAGLVERARAKATLAGVLLARPELSAFDRAALYRHASPSVRAEIRASLAVKLRPASTPRLALAPDMRVQLLAVPDATRIARTLADLGIGPSRAAAATGLVGDDVEQDLFAFALVALGLLPHECVRVFLALDPAISHDFETIRRLAELARTTSLPVATYLALGETTLGARGESRPAEAPPRPAHSAARGHDLSGAVRSARNGPGWVQTGS